MTLVLENIILMPLVLFSSIYTWPKSDHSGS